MAKSDRPSSSASPLSAALLAPAEVEEEGHRTVVVAAYPSLMAASLAKGHLAAHGVEALLFDEHTVGIAWHLAEAVGGVKVAVHEEDAARAKEVLEVFEEGAAALEAETSKEHDEADEERASGRDEREALATRALGAALIGAVFLPPLTLYSLLLVYRFFLTREGEASPGAKARAALALGFDSLVLLVIGLLLF